MWIKQKGVKKQESSFGKGVVEELSSLEKKTWEREDEMKRKHPSLFNNLEKINKFWG